MRENRSMPPSDVIPVLGYPDVAAAIAWLGEAFGFRVRWQAGGHRAQLAVGSGAVVVTDAPASVATIMVRIADADAHHEHARGAGATILAPPADQPYGERQYTAQDPAGHRWTFSQTIADVAPEAWGGMSFAG
jgi:uncharacterized glyoxalase superfamily protein PhnB